MPHAQWHELLRQGRKRVRNAAGEDSENESSSGEGAAKENEMEEDDGAQDEEGRGEMEGSGGTRTGRPIERYLHSVTICTCCTQLKVCKGNGHSRL